MDFDAKARNWDTKEKIVRAQAFAAELKAMLPLKNDWHALEFGAGTGLLSLNLINQFDKITMIDTSAGMIEVLKEKITALKNPKLRAENVSIEELVNRGEEFDAIYTSMVLHHIPDIHEAIFKFERLLKPGGYLCIIDLMREDGGFHGYEAGFTGHHGFEPEQLKTEMNKINFCNIIWHKFFKIGKTVNETLREYPLFILAGQKKTVR